MLREVSDLIQALEGIHQGQMEEVAAALVTKGSAQLCSIPPQVFVQLFKKKLEFSASLKFM